MRWKILKNKQRISKKYFCMFSCFLKNMAGLNLLFFLFYLNILPCCDQNRFCWIKSKCKAPESMGKMKMVSCKLKRRSDKNKIKTRFIKMNFLTNLEYTFSFISEQLTLFWQQRGAHLKVCKQLECAEVSIAFKSPLFKSVSYYKQNCCLFQFPKYSFQLKMKYCCIMSTTSIWENVS